MKKKTLAIFLIAIVALSIGSWFVYSQISDLNSQISDLQALNRELQNQNRDLQNENNELQEQLNELQKQINETRNPIDDAHKVKITEFEWTDGFNPIIGLTLGNLVNVTVQNTGANNVSGLTLSVRMIYNGAELGHSTGFTRECATLHAGESWEIKDWVYYDLGNRPKGTTCVCTLMWGNVILEQITKPISWG